VGFTADALDQILPRPVEKLGDGVGLALALRAEDFERTAVEVKPVDDFALAFRQFFETELEELPLPRLLPLALEMSRLHHLLEVGVEERHGRAGALPPGLVAVVVQGDGSHPGDHVRAVLKVNALFPGGEIGELQQVTSIR
jgi:hypothetical protein